MSAMVSKSLSTYSTVSPASSAGSGDDHVGDCRLPVLALAGQEQLYVDGPALDRRSERLDCIADSGGLASMDRAS